MNHAPRRAFRALSRLLLSRLLLSGLVALLAAAPVFAQDPPIKWGDIPEEHLAMTTYPADTNATVVILADYGRVEFESDLTVVFRRHRRIKILSEKGYDWGSFSIAYNTEDRMQNVGDVKGQTFTLGPDGKPKRHVMDKKSIFTENLDGQYKRIRFTLPALAPGAVVEYQYTLRSDSPLLVPDWSFQTSEPTLWSEFRPEFPQTLGYVRATRGVLNYHIETEEEALRMTGQTRKFRYVMRDVPALREEPYMTTPENYRARIEYQLAAFYDHGLGKARQFLRTWDELAKELIGNDAFGRQLDRPRRSVREQVESLTAGLTTDLDKLRAIYGYLRTQVTFDGNMGLFLDHDLDDVLKARRGSSPEIALLLVSMLREAGLEAYPVLISTRSHGNIVDSYPLYSQFNDVIVRATAGGQTFLLDATDPLRPYDLLPFDALNWRGWLVRKEDAQWIDIKTESKYAHVASVTAELSEDGTLTGTLSASDDGYSALYKRRRLKDDGAEKLVREVLLDGLSDVRLDSHRVENADDVAQPLRTTASFSVPAYAQAAGDFLYLNPTLLDRTEENPLKLPERTFPVDFGYPSQSVYNLRLKLPEGYEVQEKPGAARVALGSGGMTYQRAVEVQDGHLVVQARFVRTKTLVEPSRYAELRDFYDRLVAAEAEQVVLKRVAEPAAVEVEAADDAAGPGGR